MAAPTYSPSVTGYGMMELPTGVGEYVKADEYERVRAMALRYRVALESCRAMCWNKDVGYRATEAIGDEWEPFD